MGVPSPTAGAGEKEPTVSFSDPDHETEQHRQQVLSRLDRAIADLGP
jgi:hypothetical protein